MARWRVLATAGTALVVAGAMALLLLPSNASRHLRAGGSRVTSTAARAPSETLTPTPSPSPVPTPSPTATSSPTPATWSGPALACGSLPLSFASSPPPGTLLSSTATLGPVTARLTGKVAEPLGGPTLSSAVLTITELGATVLSAPVAPPKSLAPNTTNIIPWDIGPTTATVFEYNPGTGSLCLAHFAGEALPTVLLGLDTGGAHCCAVVRAWLLVPGGVLPAEEDDLGNPGASVHAEGDQAILVSADNTFAYQFSGYAGSGMPVLVLGFAQGTFVDITREHRDLVQADAARFWNYVTNYPNEDGTVGLGLLAPWVADECLLGQETQAWATVDGFLARGKLGGPPPAGASWPSGQAYVTALRTFLRRHGYCS